MNLSLDLGAVMKVGEHLLLKFGGQMTGLATETFETPEGAVFIKGAWYSPVDIRLRNDLKRRFDKRVPQTESVGDADAWMYMRGMNSNQGTSEAEIDTAVLMTRVKSYLEKPADQLPARFLGFTPREFREKFKYYAENR